MTSLNKITTASFWKSIPASLASSGKYILAILANMRPLIKIINIHFWKSIVGPFFAFGFPVIFVAILGTLIGYQSMFAALISISSIAVALAAMPQAIFEFKQSTLLKRIGITPIKPWMFLCTSAGYYVMIMIIGTISTFCISLLIFVGNFNVGKEIAETTVPWSGGTATVPVIAFSISEILGNTNWGGFIWSIIMCIIVSTSLGMMIMSVSKNIMMISGLGIPILIISQFLAGQVLPISMLRPVDALWYMSYITPLKPAVSLLIQSSQGMFVTTPIFDAMGVPTAVNLIPTESINIFDINSEFHVMETSRFTDPVFSVAENVLNLILPFVWTGLFIFISLKKFKWSTR